MADPSTPVKGFSGSGESPKLRVNVFAGSKGGTGKTTVMFHAAAQYASDHPTEKVLVVDCSFAGDLSERLLGGAAEDEHNQTAGEASFKALHPKGKSAANFFAYLNSNMTADDEAAPGTTQRSSLLSAWGRFSLDKGKPAPLPPALANVANAFSVLVRDVNPRVTLDNLYLIPGGATGAQPCAQLAVDDRRLAKTLRDHLRDLPGTWRVLFDTDGDLELSTSMRVVLRAADTCALFTETDPADFRRIRVFCEDVHEMRQDITEERAMVGGERWCASIAVVCFNKVRPSTDHKPFAELGCDVKPLMVAVRELIDSFSHKLSSFVLAPTSATVTRGLFAHMPSSMAAPGSVEEDRIAAFKRSSFLVVQEFLKLGILASDLGIPFCCMQPSAKYVGEHGSYTVDNHELLARLVKNVQELNARL